MRCLLFEPLKLIYHKLEAKLQHQEQHSEAMSILKDFYSNFQSAQTCTILYQET